MVDINDILDNVTSVKKLTKVEKFKILRSKIVDIKVKEYLMNRLNNLYIEVLNKCGKSLFELMKEEKLEGWCWETTESAIIFLNDDDYIERGYLKFDEETRRYYHSWICFIFDGIEYVLDPCLNLLCRKSHYSKIFLTDIRGRVSASEVREELIKQITTPKENNLKPMSEGELFLKRLLGEDYDAYIEMKKSETRVNGPEDVNTPLYRNYAGYKAEIENGKIKKLTAHYYWS